MQLSCTGATATHDMCNCYSYYASYSKGSHYTAILDSIANALPFVLANKELVSVPALPALEVWWLLTADFPAPEEVLCERTHSAEAWILVAHCAHILSLPRVVGLASGYL
jgi:hypothetical protein